MQAQLQLAHRVRNTAAGLRYVIYLFVTDLKDPGKVIVAPGGYLIAPLGEERVGDVSYAFTTPYDPLHSYDCVQQRIELIKRNLEGGFCNE